MSIRECRIVLLEGVHANALTLLQGHGFQNVEVLPYALEGKALAEKLAHADVVGVRSRTKLTKEILTNAPHLKVIGCFCIGTNQVDLGQAAQLGMPVFNAPFSNTRSVAELVIAEIICLLRKLMEKNYAVHSGAWPKDAKGAFEARGKTLGIIGYGNIGAQLSVLAESLGMRVVFYDVVNKLPIGNAQAMPSMAALLECADVVSLHVPELPSTYQLIDEKALKQMKPGAILINAARGQCVDLGALASALASGRLRGAALDVFPVEPKSVDEALVSELRGMNNVILTPHIGGSTEEAQANIGVEVADKLCQYLLNGATVGAVNFPEVVLPLRSETHRLVHIHHNFPGILSAVNQHMAERGINILAQSLMTKEDIGYLILDMAADDAEAAFAGLRAVEGTIRTRLIA